MVNIMINNEELIEKYINGEEIDELTINELENSKGFMISVIEKTNDKNFYFLCSNNLQNDYEFINYLMNKFKNDINYLCKIANNFIDNINNEVNRMELVIKMCLFTKDKNLELYNKYKLIEDTIYESKKVFIEEVKLNSDQFVEQEIGMGFLIIYNDFNNNDLILKFYAEKFIDEIFNDINLETMIHSKFKNKNELNKMGINSFLINYIANYDVMLSSFLSTHSELLKNIKKKINIILDNYDIYEDKNERIKYNMMFEKVHEYMENIDSLISENNLIYYIGKQMGIIDKISKYDSYSIVFDDLDEEFIEDVLAIDLQEKLYYTNVLNIMKSIIFNETYNDDNKCEIIDIRKRRK